MSDKSPAVAFTIVRTAAFIGISRRELVQVNAIDDRGVADLSLFVDGALKGRDSSAPFTIRWSAKGVTPGRHTLVCTASDLMGNSTSASITVTAK